MNKANVYVAGSRAGQLIQDSDNEYRFQYDEDYSGLPVSLTMPIEDKEFLYDSLPPFFEGLLPEGEMLEGLLRQKKIDRSDLFAQLIAVGADMVGSVTVEEVNT
jgi:serine/threonine-protein kinase HipA